MENLITLCERDHELIHNRELWIVGNAETAEFTETNPRGRVPVFKKDFK